ncbi:hypothetical protein QUV83_08095 [Cellulomonas cellasea]|uniref:hypothetical protein n=1 Tax=Cellulomonas cellasea TaxID=43670 RepID=UPI0025A4137E|nr:hypothetical protein [Cellulomonas cellasea]MDM8084720.1 hypothetical protein [Cellulomonas cellasea]
MRRAPSVQDYERMTNTARVKAAEILARQHALLDAAAERIRAVEATSGQQVRTDSEQVRAALDGTPGYTAIEQARRLHDINLDTPRQDAA